MIAKTEAIALALRPFSRTSRMVVWLSRDYGRIVTPVKGACRPKSFYLGQIDVGYRSELLFYERDSGGVHNIRETTPLDCRVGLRANWRAAVAADYVCALTSQSVETLLDSSALFDDLDATLAGLCAGTDPLDALVAYEFALLSRLGLRPNFDFCPECPFGSAERRECRFVISAGRMSCFERVDFERGEDTVALSPELLQALRDTLAGRPLSAQPPPLALGVRRFLGMFLSHHLDLAPYSRRAALAWLDYGIQRA